MIWGGKKRVHMLTYLKHMFQGLPPFEEMEMVTVYILAI